MQLDKDKLKYLREKRKKLLVALLLVAIFGFILYGATLFAKKDREEKEAVSGGLFDIGKKLENTDITSPDTKHARDNILKAPLHLPFTIKDGMLVLKKNFKLKGTPVKNGIFSIDYHGETLYSTGFSCDGCSFFCQGVMKKGADRFFIYYCREISAN